MWRMTRACLTMGLVAMASWVLAQGPRGPGGGPGFGGPGFGGPGMRMAGPNAAILLAGMEGVQKELALTDAQRVQVVAMQSEMRSTMDETFRNFNPATVQDLSEEERQQQFEANRKKIEAVQQEVDAKLNKLLDEKQRGRLQQLRLQREGVAAMSREDIAKQLALTDEQLQKLRALQPMGGFGPPRPNPRNLQSALATLTDEQKAKWQELTGPEFKFPEGNFGPPGGGPGGFGGQERKLVKEFDKDKDGKLSTEERKAARVAAKASGGGRGFGGGPGGGPGSSGPGGRGPGPGGRIEPGKPGPRILPEDVMSYPEASLYDTSVLRTLFFTFENEDWESEIADFHNTDVDVPATLMVDGKTYKDVGLHFRGMSSYGMIPAGSKRSLNVSIDHGDGKQRLYGYKTLNLLNAHEDPSFMHTVLYSHIARKYIPAPKANFVKVVINGESWGLYVNVQQFDKIFVTENYASPKAARWKVRGSPGGGGGLEYLGDNLADYKRRYEIKSEDKDDAWRALVKLCKTMEETPADKLVAALEPMLDIDGVLWFLALDNGLINGDGYWIRASDYSIALDSHGKFHMIPHDMNEAFHAARGPGAFGGGRGGPGGSGGGLALDPLVGLDDISKPLRSKLLAVPELRDKYLTCVRTLADESLDWAQLGPVVEKYRALIEKEVAADTRKLSSTEAFRQAVETVSSTNEPQARGVESLHSFAIERRQTLLSHPEIKRLAKP